MDFIIKRDSSDDELQHHGILGQKWGVRRYQNEDGSLKPAGEKRYNNIQKKYDKMIEANRRDADRTLGKRQKNAEKILSKYDKKINKLKADKSSYDSIKNGLKDKNGRDILTKDDVKNERNKIQAKINEINSEKRAKMKDFNEGTKAVKDAYKKYGDNIEKYKNAELKKFMNKEFKNSPEYKSARQLYDKQMANDLWLGKDFTIIDYAHKSAVDRYSKNV